MSTLFEGVVPFVDKIPKPQTFQNQLQKEVTNKKDTLNRKKNVYYGQENKDL